MQWRRCCFNVVLSAVSCAIQSTEIKPGLHWKFFKKLEEFLANIWIKKTHTNSKIIFSLFWESYCAIYHFIFFKNIAFIPAPSEWWCRCFQCWPPFLLHAISSSLIAYFPFPRLCGLGKLIILICVVYPYGYSIFIFK